MSRGEVLEAGRTSAAEQWWSGRREGWRQRWHGLPPRRRRGLAALLVVLVAVPTGAVAVHELRQRAAERARVALRVDLDVAADSTNPPGGAVWFSAVLTNDGPLPVRVDTLTGRGAGLHLGVAPPPSGRPPAVPRTLGPGRQLRVLLSVRVFCADRLASRSQPDGAVVRADLTVTPADGRSRAVSPELAGTGPVTEAADVVCRYRPWATGVELSGPVLRA